MGSEGSDQGVLEVGWGGDEQGISNSTDSLHTTVAAWLTLQCQHKNKTAMPIAYRRVGHGAFILVLGLVPASPSAGVPD